MDLKELAKETRNYSGAELEGVVRSAAAFAFGKMIDFTNLGKEASASDIRDLKITKENFDNALLDIRPIFGKNEADFKSVLEFPFLEYSKPFSQLLKQLRLVVAQVRGGEKVPSKPRRDNTRSPATSPERSASTIPHSTLLLKGKPQTGKSALAALLAKEANFPFVRVVSPTLFIGKSDQGKIHLVDSIFNDASKCEQSCIILEDIEKLVEYVHVGQRFNNTLLQGFKTLLARRPPSGKNLLVIATATCTDDIDFVRDFELQGGFENV